jgi:hypothetical protein
MAYGLSVYTLLASLPNKHKTRYQTLWGGYLDRTWILLLKSSPVSKRQLCLAYMKFIYHDRVF